MEKKIITHDTLLRLVHDPKHKKYGVSYLIGYYVAHCKVFTRKREAIAYYNKLKKRYFQR